MRYAAFVLAVVIFAALAGCGGGGDSALACAAQPEIMPTGAGVDFVRTPDSCFDSLPD